MSDDEFGHTDVRSADRDKRRPRFGWTGPYEATFFRSLCESVQRGLRENHSFKSEAWDRAARALRDQHGAYPTKSHLVNKSDNARKKFRLWRGLREHPDFLYNPVTRTVTASDQAWNAHIAKEPLSRALRNRPFEHEEYMEILYPDVVGSGGAPKRIMKPKRKGPDAIPGVDDADMPGTAVLDLQGFHASRQPPAQRVPAVPSAPQPTMPRQVGAPGPRPTSTAIPPRSAISNTSALTPPEDTATQSRKRFMPSSSSTVVSDQRGSNSSSVATSLQAKRRRISSQAAVGTAGGSTETASVAIGTEGRQLLGDGLASIAEILRSSKPKWSEQALDIFFRDFADEDMDLQLKIAEKALADDTKAMVFCKMPAVLRGHWVKRLREVNNRVA